MAATPSEVAGHPLARVVGAVEAALGDDAAGVPAWSMSAAEQRAVLVALARVESRLAALRLGVVAQAYRLARQVAELEAHPLVGAEKAATVDTVRRSPRAGPGC